MSKDCMNIYKRYRDNAGFTQEQAAAFLHISVRTLSEYENGKTPPNDIVAAMAKEYNAPKLVTKHIRLACPEFAEYLPEPKDIDNIYQAMVELERLEKDAHQAREQLDVISQDETINDKDRILYFQIYKKKSS